MAGFLATFMLKLGMNTDDVTKGLRSARRDLDSWSRDITALGTKLTAGITLPLVGVGAAALKVAGELEQNSVAFKTMLGSAQAAQAHLNELKQFALSTPFQFNDLTLASKRLQALGFEGKTVIPILTTIGDAASALGMGADGIQRITTALGQMKAKGTVQAEEMRQLAEAGIPAWQILAKTLNTDVAGAMKLVEQRAVDSGTAVPAILAGINEKFGGLMKEQSKTLLGQFSNLKDALTFTLQDLGTTLAPVAKSAMDGVIQPMLTSVKDLAAGFAAMPPGLQQATIAIAGFLAAAGPAGLVLGGLTSGLSNIVSIALKLPAMLNPVVLVLTALGTAAGIGLYELNKSTAGLKDLDATFSKFLTGLVTMEKDYEYAHKKLDEALANGVIGLTAYNEALAILEDREKKALGPGVQSMYGDFGVKLRVIGEEAKKTAPAVKEVADKFQHLAFAQKSLANAIIEYNAQQAGSEQQGIVKWLAEWQKNGGVEGWQKQVAGTEVPTVSLNYDDSGTKQLVKDLRSIPPEVAAINDALDSFGLSSDRANIPLMERQFAVLGDAMERGAIDTDTYVLAWLRLVKAMEAAGKPIDAATKKAADDLETQYGGAIKKVRVEVNEFQRQIDRSFNALSRGIAKSIVEWKGFGSTLKDIAKDTATSFLEIMIRQLLKPLEAQFAKLAGALGKALGLGGGGSDGSLTGAGGTRAGTDDGFGGGTGGVGSIASGAAGWVGAIGSVGSAVSGFISNFQMAGMNKSLDVLVNHTLRTANELMNFRADAWTREGHLMLKLDDMWNEIRNVVSAVKSGGSGGKGGITFNSCSFTGSPNEIASAIFTQAQLAGAL